ncbi:MAG: hypothetical protein IKC30_05150 [Rikenellaceae bacterium]|nr:hypothetical protein [Rikenellaceae bacterium]MBR7096342.1 hypothetical protein [Alistipes sp.]
MAKKQTYLAQVCQAHYGKGNHSKLSANELQASAYYDEIMNIYKRLGGILDVAPTRVGAYDIDTPNFIIEFDEENHFNRYRLSTLNSTIYTNNRNVNIENYKKFCKNYEHNCLTYGKYAHNSSTDKQFGNSVIDLDLLDQNRTRWKQRAFYDFIKDVTSIIIGVPIIRISIYEKYKGVKIEDLINRQCKELLIEYINLRLQNLNQ